MAKKDKDEAPGNDASPAAEYVTESITYTPGDGDPSHVKWGGHTFMANVPKEITGHAEGTAAERLNHSLIESARGNKHFTVGRARRKRDVMVDPKTPEEYRAYIVGWLKDTEIDHADKLIKRFAKDRELQLACEVGSDDFAYIGTILMPKLAELAKADELTETQVSQLWIDSGVNQLPF